jgi:HD-GYP domain-containing protein (c-di-GMP phosphodiesterase class II)
MLRPSQIAMPDRGDSGRRAEVRSNEVISALSYALDIVEGQPEGHAVRSCMIGMRLAGQVSLDSIERSSLLYALLLKDLGCSSNAAKVCYLFGSDDRDTKRDLKTTDWRRGVPAIRYVLRNIAREGTLRDKVSRFAAIAWGGKAEARAQFQLRCDRGASIALDLGFDPQVAHAIRALDEHWDGGGHPAGLRRTQIPYLARILCLAQTIEVFVAKSGLAAAAQMVRRRAKRWFDPELCKAFQSMLGDAEFWNQVIAGDAPSQRRHLLALEPMDRVRIADEAGLDRIASAFGQVIDAKSPWTHRHSAGVSDLAVGIGERTGLDPVQLRSLRRAGWLHDIGKLGVSNTILNKRGRLTDDELEIMRLHPAYTHRILERVSCFASFADLAASHHERLDGRGYHRGLDASQLDAAARALVVADIYEALAAKRPYRADLSADEVHEIMRRDVGAGICPAAFEALQDFVAATKFRPYAMAA